RDRAVTAERDADALHLAHRRVREHDVLGLDADGLLAIGAGILDDQMVDARAVGVIVEVDALPHAGDLVAGRGEAHRLGGGALDDELGAVVVAEVDRRALAEGEDGAGLEGQLAAVEVVVVGDRDHAARLRDDAVHALGARELLGALGDGRRRALLAARRRRPGRGRRAAVRRRDRRHEARRRRAARGELRCRWRVALAARDRGGASDRERPEASHAHDVLRNCAGRTSGAKPAGMPETVYIQDIARDLDRYDGQEVTLRGWLYNKRSSKKVHFLEVRDGTGILQCVAGINDVAPEIFARTDKLPQETSLLVTGKVRRDSRSPIGFELGVTNLQVVAEPAGEYPITPEEHGTAFLMDHRHLGLRSKRQHAILRVRAEIIAAVRNYFDSHGFTLVDAPIFTPAACEGTTNLFEVGYFDDKAYLTQSGQLYMEAAAMALGK